MLEEDDKNIDLRDRVRLWMESNGHFDLSMRIAMVPEEIVKQLLGKTADVAERILEENGY